MKCGWMDWCGSDYTDTLDLSALEATFGMDITKTKQELPGGCDTGVSPDINIHTYF